MHQSRDVWLNIISHLICNRNLNRQRCRESIRSWGNNKNEKSEKSVLLDLTADGDVFVPDRRLGRSRRLIDSFFPLFACVAPDRVLCFHRFLSLSFAPLSSSLFFPFQKLCFSLSLAQSPVSSEIRRRHFAPRRRHSCFCRGAYK